MAAAASCSRAPAPAARTDAPRVVALGPALTIILRDAGLEPLIVGRHAVDTRLNQVLSVGDQVGIDLEALGRARPTHVYVQWGARDLPAQLTDMARAGGWSLVNLPLLTLADVDRAVARLREDLGGATPIEPVTSRIAALRQDRSKSGRVLLLHTAGPPAALGPGSYHHEILVLLGATPALTDGKPYMNLDAEDVLRLKPDAIILLQPGDRASPGPGVIRGVATLRDRLGPLADLDVPAIRLDRVAALTDADVLVPGTNLVGVAEAIARVLDGWAAAGPAR